MNKIAIISFIFLFAISTLFAVPEFVQACTNTCSVTVNVGAHGSSNLASQTVDSGTTLKFVFTPDLGYHVRSVSVNGTSLGAVGSLTVKITGDTSVNATFSVNQYTISATSDSNGQINPSGTINVNYGASQTFSFTPNTGYNIADVFLNGSSVLNSVTGGQYTISDVTGNTTIVSSFALNQLAVNQFTITVNAGTNGKITPGTGPVNNGDTPTYTITPNTGYYIASITVNGQPVIVITPQGQSYQFSPVTSDESISATFATNQNTINQYTITVQSEHGSPTSSANVNPGDSFTASVTSPDGDNTAQWVCTGYSIDNGQVTGTGTTYTFNNVNQNHIITFNWKQQFYLTVTSTYGTTSGSGWYDSGITAYASLNTATATSGGIKYVFNGWNSDASGSGLTSNPIIMNSAKSATANWAAASSSESTATVTSTPTPSSHSAITSTPTTNIYSTTNLTPSPSPKSTINPKNLSPTPQPQTVPLYTVGETALIIFALLLLTLGLLALGRRKKKQGDSTPQTKLNTLLFS